MSCGIHLDSALDVLEEMRFKKKYSALIQKLTKETHLTYTEIESLLIIYYKVQKDQSSKSNKHVGMTRGQLKLVLHAALDMTDEESVSDIVMSLVRGINPIVPMETWVKLMSLYLRGTNEEKIQYCFKCYDLMNAGVLGRDAMLRLLNNSLLSHHSDDDDQEDAVGDLIEILLKKMDLDRDGRISSEDFRQSCLRQPLLMEYLGNCLPTRSARHTFLTTFTTNVGKL